MGTCFGLVVLSPRQGVNAGSAGMFRTLPCPPRRVPTRERSCCQVGGCRPRLRLSRCRFEIR